MTEEIVETESLETLAEKINACVEAADAQILEAAMLIRAARDHFDNDEKETETWEDWARENIKLSGSRLRELLRIAKSEDPDAELKRLREMNKARQDRHRRSRKPAPLRNDGQTDSVSVALEDEREQLITWARSAPIAHVIETLDFTKGLGANDETSVPNQSEEEIET